MPMAHPILWALRNSPSPTLNLSTRHRMCLMSDVMSHVNSLYGFFMERETWLRDGAAARVAVARVPVALVVRILVVHTFSRTRGPATD